jgi:hypothetical protein
MTRFEGTSQGMVPIRHPEYVMRSILIADTVPKEHLLVVDGLPSVTFKSLASPALRGWVSTLPQGSRLIRDMGELSEAWEEVQDFAKFCQRKGVTFALREVSGERIFYFYPAESKQVTVLPKSDKDEQ